MIVKKIYEDSTKDRPGDKTVTQLRILIPSAAAGGIIGRGGCNIKAIGEESGARIQLSPKDVVPPSIAERIVTLTGELDQCLKAVSLVMRHMQEDISYSTYQNTTTNYGSGGRHHHSHVPHGGSLGGVYGAPGGLGGGAAAPSYPPFGAPPFGHMYAGGGSAAGRYGYPGGPGSGPPATVVIAVPDMLVGAIVGRGGATISELQRVSGARIKISQKGDFVPGTTNRTVTITGAPQATQAAQYLISQKVQPEMAVLLSDSAGAAAAAGSPGSVLPGGGGNSGGAGAPGDGVGMVGLGGPIGAAPARGGNSMDGGNMGGGGMNLMGSSTHAPPGYHAPGPLGGGGGGYQQF